MSKKKERNFERVPMRLYGRLTCDKFSTDVHVVNLSEGGALLAILDDESRPGMHKFVKIALEIDFQKELHVQGQVVHLNAHLVGVSFGTPPPETRIALKKFIKSSGF
ncbi:PilZ domain-containing protein [Alteromonadaceae bacterium 2753L.S.0a.02]|nr:PilZ domain-containing protein [Alteromonadaceae bacterium 2753L.S.0a.02]